MSRAEAAGDQRHIAGKIAARYDAGTEAEVLGWFKALIGKEITPGMRNVEKELRNGQDLVRLAAKVREGTPNCPAPAKKMTLKPNTMSAPFKQMENITVFLSFCEKYGVPKTGLFQTVDIYEGRNMAQFLSSICMLGTEAQRHGFTGPTIGAKPTERAYRQWTHEQLKAGQGIIGLQAGTNKYASQSGMSMGGVRHCADIRADDMDRVGQGVIGIQAGSNKFASQKGMSIGGVRHCADIRCDDHIGHDVIGLQAGSNKGASQRGMSMGGVRHGADIRCDDIIGHDVIGLQAGSNRFASQKGMSMGGVRHGADIRCDNALQAGSNIIGLQMGSNKFASQKGMTMGGVRHAADIRADDATQAGAGVIGLQMGSNQGASQAGMSMGTQRHVSDIRVDPMEASSSGVINLQYGSNQYSSQSGMTMGGRRDIKSTVGDLNNLY